MNKNLLEFFENFENDVGEVELIPLPHREIIQRVLEILSDDYNLYKNFIDCRASPTDPIPDLDDLIIDEEHELLSRERPYHRYRISLTEVPSLFDSMYPNATIEIQIFHRSHIGDLYIIVWFRSGNLSEKFLQTEDFQNRKLISLTCRDSLIARTNSI